MILTLSVIMLGFLVSHTCLRPKFQRVGWSGLTQRSGVSLQATVTNAESSKWSPVKKTSSDDVTAEQARGSALRIITISADNPLLCLRGFHPFPTARLYYRVNRDFRQSGTITDRCSLKKWKIFNDTCQCENCLCGLYCSAVTSCRCLSVYHSHSLFIQILIC